ncbi:MAG: hypothetical protein GW778_03260 [Alphaproteobacteria bacterium]|nr:hypothetical protein [Alphaproteobacteria bacterium]
MILTCPKCASRFNLLASLLAPEGRRVKCSNCGEIWQQLPDPDELIAEIEMRDRQERFEDDDDDGLEDIPNAVKPIPDGGADAAEDDSAPREKTQTSLALIIISALAMFIFLSAPVLIMKNTITKTWPKTIAFYQAIGMSVDVPGEGIVFDQMRGNLTNDKFTLTGQVINLTAKDSILPLIEVTLIAESGETIGYHYIRMPKEILSAEETLPIKAEYDIEEPSAVFDASIRFVITPKVDLSKMEEHGADEGHADETHDVGADQSHAQSHATPTHDAKTVSEGDDNTHVPHADESHPPHDAAKAPKSPAHDDAPPHQESSHAPHQADHH